MSSIMSMILTEEVQEKGLLSSRPQLITNSWKSITSSMESSKEEIVAPRAKVIAELECILLSIMKRLAHLKNVRVHLYKKKIWSENKAINIKLTNNELSQSIS